MNPDAWGIARAYREASGRERAAPATTVSALLEAMGAEDETPPEARVVVARRGDARPVPGAQEVVTEDGRALPVEGGLLPRHLGLGYHRLVWEDGDSSRLVVSPGRCHLPPRLRTWGWALQLYALRSFDTWGMGDLGTLGRVMEWARALGSGMTLVSPLHATSPGAPQEASPYFPGSRLWRNPLYIAVDDVPGAADGDERLEELRASGRAHNRDARIDRDAIYALKMEALARLWARRVPDAGFDAFLRRHGRLLESFATFQALAESFGREPAAWPSELRRPGTGAVARFRAENLDRVRFHCWLQWLLDAQLGRAARRGGLVQDLAIGVAPDGADAWVWQDVLARGVRVGAPPDEFNALGQDWGVLAFDPWRLRAADYEPFVQTVRWSLAEGGGLRFDHVMGLWRLFWIPAGARPEEGTYVRYPAADLLDILALESVRASAYVVGEDLGTVEGVVREEMAARALLSCRIMWFEDAPPSEWPQLALAAVANHDLPTVAGVWSGDDVAAQRALGLHPDESAHAALRARLTRWLNVPEDAPVQEVIDGVHRLLARAPSALLAAQLEDALGIPERHNHPGTTTEWPNWARPLPLSFEELRADERVGAVAHALSRRGPAG